MTQNNSFFMTYVVDASLRTSIVSRFAHNHVLEKAMDVGRTSRIATKKQMYNLLNNSNTHRVSLVLHSKTSLLKFLKKAAS